MLDSKRTRVLDYTSEELEEIKNIHPSEWTKIMKEICEKEMEQINYENLKDKKKMQEDFQVFENEMETKQIQLIHSHENRLEEIEAVATKKIDFLRDNTRKREEEHRIEIKNKEEVHRLKLQMKKDELLELSQKAGEKNSRYKEAAKTQEDLIQKREQELDSYFSKQWDDQQQKFEQDAEILDTQLLDKQLQFDKEMEEGRIAMEKEFDSQITTELKMTSENGSTLEMREKQPGIVTDFINTVMPS